VVCVLTVAAQHPRGAVGRSLNVVREGLLLLVVAVWLRVVRLLSSALSILALRVFFFEYTNELLRTRKFLGIIFGGTNATSYIWLSEGVSRWRKRGSNDHFELDIADAKVCIVKDIESFPLPFELGEMLGDIITIRCTLPKKGTLYGDGDLIVPCLVDGLETFPDLVRSVKSSDMYHLILGYVVCYYDLGVHVVDVPGGSDLWI